MSTNDGGPAFPSGDGPLTECPAHAYGMSLRDYFAAKAMQAIIANVGVMSYMPFDKLDSVRREIWEAGDEDTPDVTHAGTAYVAYEIADAMLAVRRTSDRA